MQDICRHLGIPLAKEKVEGPTTCITFLGIEIDEQVRLPMAKVEQLRVLLEEWKQVVVNRREAAARSLDVCCLI